MQSLDGYAIEKYEAIFNYFFCVRVQNV